MALRFGILCVGLSWSTLSSISAIVTLTTSDPSNTSSFNSAGCWDSGSAPSAGNDYIVSNLIMRTPTAVGSYTFAGNSLTIKSNAQIVYKGGAATGTIAISNLILDGGTISNWSPSANPAFAGATTLMSGGGVLDQNLGYAMTYSSVIAGVGALKVTAGGATVQSTKALYLTASNSYQGGTTIGKYTYVDAQSDGAFGAGNVTMTGGMLKLELGAANNYINDSAKLILSAGLVDGAVELNFNGTDNLAGISLDGGSTYLQAGSYNSTTLNTYYGASVFTGSGVLNVVPEPHTAALALMGGFGLLLGHLRKTGQEK